MLYKIDPVRLYYLGANSRMYEWRIAVKNNELYIEHGPYKGIMNCTIEEIDRGKGGRSIFGQIKSRFESRVNTQRLRGYKDSIEEASRGRTNSLDLPKPMLAQVWKNVKDVNIEDCYVQWKYNGNRCLITRQGSEIIAYSRKGKIITSINHITDNIDIPDGMVIDGELYCHNTPLPTIRSWISRHQKDTLKLKYHAYDLIAPVSYDYRLKYLQQFKLGEAAEIAPTARWRDLPYQSIGEMMDLAQEHNYEGLILRTNNKGYEVGKRSKSLLKVKSFLDQEFIVDNIYLSDKGMPMATCYTDDGQAFDVVLPGTQEIKKQTFLNKDAYLQKPLTIEFSEWTPAGLPFHAIAKCWHEDV